KGKIIQYSYGDDNFDTTKVEKQELKLLDYSIDDIYAHYSFGEYFATENPSGSHLGVFSTSTAKRMKTQKKDLEEYCKKYIHFMIEARDTLIEKIFINNNDIQIITAVSFQFIIANIQGQLGLNHAMSSDITPKEAFEMIEEYFQKLELMESIKPNYLFKIMYFFYLSPRSLLVDKRFTKNALQLLLETILLRYKQSFVHPGEMVGILAGQSIGEPTTQMTLNSVIYETMIIVKHNLIHQSVMIGEFIDFVMENDCNKVIWTKENDTSYAECKTNFEIASIDTKGEISWKKIEAVTKHPVVNKDGTNTMLEIITERQRKVVATKAKSFLQCIEGEIVEIAGDQLRVGDYLPISLENDYDEVHKLQYITLLKNDDENIDILMVDDNNLKYVEEKKEKIPNRKLDGSIEFIDKPATMKDVIFDRIISIREVKNTTNYAYDLTVQDTRNFILMNGLCMRDTFHLAGVASKSNVTQGVPRLEELLGMTEEPKNQSLTIYLRHFDQEDNAKAIKYATMIEHTRLVDVVNYSKNNNFEITKVSSTTVENIKNLISLSKNVVDFNNTENKIIQSVDKNIVNKLSSINVEEFKSFVNLSELKSFSRIAQSYKNISNVIENLNTVSINPKLSTIQIDQKNVENLNIFKNLQNISQISQTLNQSNVGFVVEKLSNFNTENITEKNNLLKNINITQDVKKTESIVRKITRLARYNNINQITENIDEISNLQNNVNTAEFKTEIQNLKNLINISKNVNVSNVENLKVSQLNLVSENIEKLSKISQINNLTQEQINVVKQISEIKNVTEQINAVNKIDEIKNITEEKINQLNKIINLTNKNDISNIKLSSINQITEVVQKISNI
ncbi:MAG: hypothetical protein EBS86_09515, partial [Crocinitomicaceae bacterium]|nr:hypothetical protein [Crocinitomicaceae bacterium]